MARFLRQLAQQTSKMRSLSDTQKIREKSWIFRVLESRHKLLTLGIIIAISLCNISCTKAQDEIAMAKAPETRPAPKEEEQEEVKVKEIKVGADISQEISEIKVKDLKGKERKLKDLMGLDRTLFIMVKPGCMYCESLLAVVNSSKPAVKPKLVIVMDSGHAQFNDFKKKAEANKGIIAEWAYDKDTSFPQKLNVKSFPRLMLVDSKGIILENQVGLVIPEDKTVLEGKPMPEVLQKLSIETIKWMKGL